MSSAGSDYENDNGENDSIRNKSRGEAKKFRIVKKTPDYSLGSQGLDIDKLNKTHQQAEKELRLGHIESALEKFYACIEQYFLGIGQDPSNTEFADYFVQTLKFLNENALHLLKEDKIGVSLRILEMCNEISSRKRYGAFPQVQNLTYNHMACCYRRMGKLETALKYLEKAIAHQSDINDHVSSGITYINLCAIYSQMGNHRKALNNAKQAVNECGFDLVKFNEMNGQQTNPAEQSKKIAMLGIAYYNLGIEEKYCGNQENSKNAFAKAYELIEKTYGPDDPFAKKFFEAYSEIKPKLNQSNARSRSPSHARDGFNNTISYKEKRPISLPRNFGNQRRNGPLPNKELSTVEQMEKVYIDSKNRLLLIPNQRTTNNTNETPSLKATINGPIPDQTMAIADSTDFNIQSHRHHKPESQSLYKHVAYRVTVRRKEETNSKPMESRPKSANPRAKQQQELYGSMSISKQQGLDDSGELKLDENQRQAYEQEINEIERIAGIGEVNFDSIDRNDDDLKNNRMTFLQNLRNYHRGSNPREKLSETNFELDTVQMLDSPIKGSSPTRSITNSSKNERKFPALLIIQFPYLDSEKSFSSGPSRNLLKTQKLIFIHKSIERYALDPADPFDKQTFEVFVWFELLNQKILFNFFSIITRKFVLKGRLLYEIKGGQNIVDFKRYAKAFAQTHLQNVTIQDGDVFFGKVTPSEIEKNLRIMKENSDSTPNYYGISLGAADWKDEQIKGKNNSVERKKFAAVQEPVTKTQEPKSLASDSKVDIRSTKATISQETKPEIEKPKPEAPQNMKIEGILNTKAKETATTPAKKTEPQKPTPQKPQDSQVKKVEPEQTKPVVAENTAVQKETPIKTTPKQPKQPTVKQIILIQKAMRGFLSRKRYFFYQKALWEILFSKNFKLKESLINLKVLQQRNKPQKTEKPSPPVHIIYGFDLTEEMRFSSVTFPSKAMNPKRASIEKLQSVLEINIYNHTIALKPEFVPVRTPVLDAENSSGKENPQPQQEVKPQQDETNKTTTAKTQAQNQPPQINNTVSQQEKQPLTKDGGVPDKKSQETPKQNIVKEVPKEDPNPKKEEPQKPQIQESQAKSYKPSGNQDNIKKEEEKKNSEPNPQAVNTQKQEVVAKTNTEAEKSQKDDPSSKSKNEAQNNEKKTQSAVNQPPQMHSKQAEIAPQKETQKTPQNEIVSKAEDPVQQNPRQENPESDAKPNEEAPTEKAKPAQKIVKKQVQKNVPAIKGALRAVEAAQRIQRMFRKKNTERVYIASFPLIFSDVEIVSYVFWIAARQKICVDIIREDKTSQELLLDLEDMELGSLRHLENTPDLDVLLLPFLSYRNGVVWFKKGGRGKKSNPK